MLSLAKASTLSLWRQLTAPLYAHTVLAILVVPLVLALPVGAWILGRAGADTIAVLLADPTLALTFLLATSLGSATGGLCMAMLAPRLSVLDEQIRAAPLPKLQLIVGAMLAPMLIPFAWIAFAGGSFLVALVAHPMISARAAAAVVVLGVTTFMLGGALGSIAPHLRALRPTALVLPLLIVPVWLVAGWAIGEDPLNGLPAAATHAISGHDELLFWSLSGLLLIIGAGGWAFHAAMQGPQGGPSAPRLVALPVPSGRAPAVVAVTLKTLGRRRDLRGNAWAVVVATPVIALLVREASPIPQTAGLFAMAAALLGSSTLVLATPAVVASPSWLWTSAGRGFAAVTASLVAGVACQAFVLLAALGPLAVLGILDTSVVSPLPAAACLAATAALVAGTVIPWNPDESARQALTMAVSFVITVALLKPLRWATVALSGYGIAGSTAAFAGASCTLLLALVAASIAIYSREQAR